MTGSPNHQPEFVDNRDGNTLERLLQLERIIRVKLAQAAASIGLDDEVIPGVQAANRSFVDAVREIGKIQQGDALGCLKHITCSRDTPRHLPDEMRDTAYSARARARADILAEWTLTTDPAYLESDIPKAARSAAAHIRRNLPPDMTQELADRVCDAIEAPLGYREQRALRQILNQENATAHRTTQQLAAFVRERGLQPWRPPAPLPPIDEEDVTLVAWMAVETAQ